MGTRGKITKLKPIPKKVLYTGAETVVEMVKRLGISSDAVYNLINEYKELGRLHCVRDWRKNSNGVWERRPVYWIDDLEEGGE